eukprot:NODE_1032_length_1151_cov_84.509982_g784_i0.p4 GENE.NODE_1032_length_1151_cov_84.509982_g784_i0~~NODE_1032_length_1151_cov_84.509982_g784_i0.p4  ORF type:complete len:60 (+),score=4.17 NODE_1032_length_1151_cov_84.509982_g784_i0:895-1074(+)
MATPSSFIAQHGGFTLSAGLFQETLCAKTTFWICTYSLQLDIRTESIFSLSSSRFVRHY